MNAADARAVAVVGLFNAVAAASTQGNAPDDVRTMFRAETLRATLRQARTDADTAGQAAATGAARQHKSSQALAAALAAIPPAHRLGLGEASLRTYANRPEIWGENRAGWQRKAVAAMPDNLGGRIETVCVSDNGTALAIPTIRSRVDAERAKTPTRARRTSSRPSPSKTTPHEADYGVTVWQIYRQLYP